MAQNDENCVDDPQEILPDLQRPKKPSSAYFYFVKKHRVRLQQQHPTWPMKRIVSSVAMLWSKTSLQNRAPFVEMAKEDSNRYKEQVLKYLCNHLKFGWRVFQPPITYSTRTI